MSDCNLNPFETLNEIITSTDDHRLVILLAYTNGDVTARLFDLREHVGKTINDAIEACSVGYHSGEDGHNNTVFYLFDGRQDVLHGYINYRVDVGTHGLPCCRTKLLETVDHEQRHEDCTLDNHSYIIGRLDHIFND